MNKTQIIGRIGKDAESKDINGKNVANFSVAVTIGKDKTEWYECAIWDKPNLTQYLKKGTQVYCEGAISANAYTTKDGEARASLRLTVFQLELLGSKTEGNPVDTNIQPARQAAPLKTTAGNEWPTAIPDPQDDLPF